MQFITDKSRSWHFCKKNSFWNISHDRWQFQTRIHQSSVVELQTGSIMDVKEQKGSFRDTLNQSCAYSPIKRTPFILATLRLRGRVGRDGFKVHFGTVLGDAFSTWRQIGPPKQSHNALDNYLDLVPPATSKWPIQSTLLKTDTFGTSAECLS